MTTKRQPRPEHLRGIRHPDPVRMEATLTATVDGLTLSGLTVKVLSKRQVENIAQRMIDMLGRLLGDDCDQLAGLALASRRIDGLLHGEVERRRQDGASWAEIAGSLSVTKQAAQQRYGATGAGATTTAYDMPLTAEIDHQHTGGRGQQPTN